MRQKPPINSPSNHEAAPLKPLICLDDNTEYFPSLAQALQEPNGLLAVGGDLSVPRLLAAYQRGIFPWFSHGDPILWWSPDPRFVLKPDNIHIGRSLRKTLARQRFTFSIDSAFSEVLAACANTPRDGQPGTWITADMIAAYQALHAAGHAHSVEAWQGNTLVGGLYGVAIGRMFFGESMFAHADDASKAAFVVLCRHLAGWGFPLIDCQMETAHLARFGGFFMPRADFVTTVTATVQSTAPIWRYDHHLGAGNSPLVS